MNLVNKLGHDYQEQLQQISSWAEENRAKVEIISLIKGNHFKGLITFCLWAKLLFALQVMIPPFQLLSSAAETFRYTE